MNIANTIGAAESGRQITRIDALCANRHAGLSANSLLAGALLALGALSLPIAGCGASEPAEPICHGGEEGIGQQASALSGWNGAGYNARGVQGSGFNASGLNASGLNASGLNGAAWQASHLQASALQGVSLQGISLQGASLNGAWANGRPSNRAYLNGRMIQGSNLQGASLQGPSLQGSLLQGTTLNGTRLVGVIDGRPLLDRELIGATLHGATSQGLSVRLSIAAVTTDESDAELTYYSLVHEGQNICGAGGKGLFLRGVWDETGRRHDALQPGDRTIDASYACTTGVLAKCIRWGYKPWKVGATLHQACSRMARADYCGDGISHTEDGTLIDLFDGAIQQPEMTAADGFHYEAGWGADGAVCVNKTRYQDVDDAGQSFLPSCWSRLPRCSDMAQAATHGALIHNASLYTERNVCRPLPGKNHQVASSARSTGQTHAIESAVSR